MLAAQIGRTRSLALSRLRAAAAGRTDRFPDSATPRATSWNRRRATAWTAGFFPGSLWQAYEWTRDPAWLTSARTWTEGVRPQATNTGTHDLGFVIGTSAGRGARLDPSRRARTSYTSTVLAAATSLATRWNERVGAVRSGTYDGQWGLIVDSVMNMELLFRAARSTGSPAEAARLRDIAHRHLLTVLRDFVRADGSTVHRLVYDPSTGGLRGSAAGQGLTTASTWSRGQAWAIYGLTTGYRETSDPRLLDGARRVAQFWMSRNAEDCVPLWDFEAPPELPLKDSSAAAVAAAGLLDLARLDQDASARLAYRTHALAMLSTLTSNTYTTVGTTHPAVLRRQSYSIPDNPREGSYIWGDHYLLEAMSKAMNEVRVTPRISVQAPAPSPYGVRLRLNVRATLPGGAPASGVALTLQRRASGSPAWTVVDSGSSGKDGRWRPEFRPRERSLLRAVSQEGRHGSVTAGGYAPATSNAASLIVTVTGRLHISSRHRSRYVLGIPRVVLPAGGHLELQERRQGRWRTVASIKSGPATTFRWRNRHARHFRVIPVVRGDVRAVPSSLVRVPAR